MKEAELLDVAADRPAPPSNLLWSSHLYGIGKWLRRYVGYPDDLPLCAEIDHGPCARTVPHQMYLDSRAPLFLFHNQHEVDVFREWSDKPCAAMGTPFAYYRWMNGIRVAADAAGTVAIPTHSTHHIKACFDWKAYCAELRRIPERFQPVTVCLYWKEILDGLHKVFMEEGFEVVCAGHIYDDRFVERFYGILSRHRFMTSNEMGTAVLYGLEMGLPFFLWGRQDFKRYNTGGDPGLPVGEYRAEEMVGMYRLDKAALADLARQGLPEGCLGRLAGAEGKKARDLNSYLAILRDLGVPGDAAHLPAILKRAAVPLLTDRRPELFQEPLLRVTAEQRAYANTLMGLDQARSRKELRRLLLDAFETMVMGGRGARLAEVGRKERDVPAAAPVGPWPACSACGAVSAVPANPVEGGSGGGDFALCPDCGTLFRRIHAPFPDKDGLGPAFPREPLRDGWQRINGLEEERDPGSVLSALRASGAEGSRVTTVLPSLGGQGLEAIRRNGDLRTVFSLIGAHRLFARAGYRVLSAFQGPDGVLRVAAEASPGAVLPPAAAGALDELERSRTLLRGGRAEKLPPHEADLIDRIAVLATGGTLSSIERSVCIGKFLDLVRNRPAILDAYLALARVYLAWGDSAAAGFWLGLASEMAGGEAHPGQEIAELHRRLGLPEAVLSGHGGEDWRRVEGPDPAGRLVDVLELLNDERFREALASAENGLRTDGENPDLLYAQAISLNKLDRRTEAMTVLRRLVAVHPDYQAAGILLARLSDGR